MKRIALLFVSVLAACAMMAGFVGCSNGSHNDAGTYNVYSLTSGSTTVSNELVKSLGMEDSVVLELKADGTGTLSYGLEMSSSSNTSSDSSSSLSEGGSASITWKDGELSEGGETITYTKIDDRIVIEIDEVKVELQKKQ